MKIILELDKDEMFMSTTLNKIKQMLQQNGHIIHQINYEENWITTVKNKFEYPLMNNKKGEIK